MFFFFFFLSHRSSAPSCANVHTFLSIDICGIGLCDSCHLCCAGLPPSPPPPSSAGSLTAGAERLASEHHFLRGHFLLQAALASCLSLTGIVTKIVSVELYLSGHRCLPPWQPLHLPAGPHLPEVFFLLPQGPSSILQKIS